MIKNYTINDDGVIRWQKNGKVPSKKTVKKIINQEGGQNSVRYMSERMCNSAREIDNDKILIKIVSFVGIALASILLFFVIDLIIYDMYHDE